MKSNFKKFILIFFSFLPLIISITSLMFLPDLIPAHYGFNGEVTRWGSKYETLIIPIIGCISCIISFLYTNNATQKTENQKNIKTLNIVTIVLIFTFNVLTISFLISDLNKLTNINNSLSIKLLYISIGVVFILIGNYLPKCKRNSHIGIRTSLTLSNDDIWFKTHRLGGKLFVIFGFMFTIISLFIPGNIAMIILTISMIVITTILIIYPKKLLNKNIIN